MVSRFSTLLLAISMFIPVSSRCFASPAGSLRTPVIVDTDIGDDIDDAFALALVIRSNELELRAVTTVTGDTQARARIAAKILWAADLRNVPVAAGVPDKRPAGPQARWADGFTSSAISSQGALSLLHTEAQRSTGGLILIAMGPLTNLAAFIQQHPEDKPKIQEIALMGGSIARGYTAGSGPTAEYNIAADATAAQTVFRSGIPLRVAPLDVTASLQLEAEPRNQIFAQHTELTEALSALYLLWGQPTPTLHDAMAVALLTKPGLCSTERVHIDIQQNGMTRTATSAPANATVALQTDPAAFIRYYVSMFQPGPRALVSPH